MTDRPLAVSCFYLTSHSESEQAEYLCCTSNLDKFPPGWLGWMISPLRESPLMSHCSHHGKSPGSYQAALCEEGQLDVFCSQTKVCSSSVPLSISMMLLVDHIRTGNSSILFMSKAQH